MALDGLVFGLGLIASVALVSGAVLLVSVYLFLRSVSKKVESKKVELPKKPKDEPLDPFYAKLSDEDVAKKVIGAAADYDLWLRVAAIRDIPVRTALVKRDDLPKTFPKGRIVFQVTVGHEDGVDGILRWPPVL